MLCKYRQGVQSRFKPLTLFFLFIVKGYRKRISSSLKKSVRKTFRRIAHSYRSQPSVSKRTFMTIVLIGNGWGCSITVIRIDPTEGIVLYLNRKGSLFVSFCFICVYYTSLPQPWSCLNFIETMFPIHTSPIRWW